MGFESVRHHKIQHPSVSGPLFVNTYLFDNSYVVPLLQSDYLENLDYSVFQKVQLLRPLMEIDMTDIAPTPATRHARRSHE